MLKKRYLYKVYPPRRNFYENESSFEKKVMAEHIQYWKDLTSMPHSVVYDPLFEQNGTFALAVIEVNSSDEADSIGMHDPAVVSGGCSYGITPMQVGRVRI